MLLNQIQSEGVELSLNNDKLTFVSAFELSPRQVRFLKTNKRQLMLEIVNAPDIEIIDGEYYPLNRIKNTDGRYRIETDFLWIHEQLRKSDNRLVAAAEYSRLYKLTFDNEPIDHKKDGAARKAANSWLLEL